MTPNKIMVTGANGFIGNELCAELIHQNFSVKAVARNFDDFEHPVEKISIPAINGDNDWTQTLSDVKAIIHLAARVHVMKDTASDLPEEFLKVNLHGTINLARQAAAAGVRRFVYVSSVKVNGDQTNKGQLFHESDFPRPQDAYAISKWQAEQALQVISQETGMEIVIVRPPLVYGPRVKANFLRLLALVDRGIPLPFASVQNSRSLIYVGNLADVLTTCVTHPAAAGQVYLVCDDENVSTSQLVRLLASCMKKNPRLLNIPVWLLKIAGVMIGRSGEVKRLLGSLQVDNSVIRQQLGWKPKITLQQGLQLTVDWYKNQHCLSGTPSLRRRSGNIGTDCNLSVVIVNYNAGEYLLRCVMHAQQQAEQIIVVDNASTDGSIALLSKAFPKIRIIRNKRNLGFAAACNLGAMAADGNHILFLNPDCFLEPDACSSLIQALNSAPDVGMVGGLLTNPDGTEQIGGRRSIPTPWRSFVRAFGFSVLSDYYPKLFSDFSLHTQPLPDRPLDVEAISGACMLVRRDALEEVGLLDEGYFMHCEDLDWCMRFRQKNWKILFVPNAKMVHFKGRCSRSRPIFVEWNKHKGMMRFYRKFFRDQYPGLLMLLVAIGVWLRFGLMVIYHSAKRAGRALGVESA